MAKKESQDQSTPNSIDSKETWTSLKDDETEKSNENFLVPTVNLRLKVCSLHFFLTI